jgi:hypothetical protein
MRMQNSFVIEATTYERALGELDGQEEARRTLAQAEGAKGGPLTKDEIHEHYCRILAAREQAYVRGEVKEEWLAGWRLAFVNTCLQALQAAPDAECKPTTMVALVRPTRGVSSPETLSAQAIAALMRDFGTFIQFLRQRSHVFQTDVRATLAQILADLASKDTYSRVELGTRAPQFRQLAAIYKAMVRSGIEIRPEEREAYLLLARKRIESKGTYHEHIGASQWEALEAPLSAFDAGE